LCWFDELVVDTVEEWKEEDDAGIGRGELSELMGVLDVEGVAGAFFPLTTFLPRTVIGVVRAVFPVDEVSFETAEEMSF
jgi:hypothetical protein